MNGRSLGLLGGQHGDVAAAGDVILQGGAIVDVAHHVGVGQQDIGGGGDGLQIVQGVAQLVQFAPAAAGIGVLGGEGGQQLEAAVLAVQVPLLAVAQVVHQGVVVLLDQHAHVEDAGVDHIGQREVHQAVTSAEGDGGHVPVLSEGVQRVGVQIRKDNTSHFHGGHPLKQFPWA